ncbi:MAG: DNA phosphorothioation-associated DGQHR protein 1 [Sulfuritalea sp.]|nr:DNA phosphorothioation-associated DGQHR protein 1 [Sulfuritalea sp.]
MNQPMTVVPDSIQRSAIRVRQPLGTFYAFCLRADYLNRITYSLPAEVVERMEKESSDNKGGYSTIGSQRPEKKSRLDEIASFIRTTDATFPNAIILAANYDLDGGYIKDEAHCWSVTGNADGPWTLHIPSLNKQSASIIDGQHRLHAFDHLPTDAPERAMELLCVVFLELPTPYHAYVFATINFNQKKVDRSLAYELFGFDVDERPARFWSPETLAVYLARLMNTEQTSPLFRSIFPAADSERLFSDVDGQPKGDVRVSMATAVDGILRLLSKNPKEDRNTIRRRENQELGRESLVPIKGVPLRAMFILGNDKAIYDVLCNYFTAVRDTVWATAGKGSYLRKTVGVQALFDVLRELLATTPVTSVNFSSEALIGLLQPCTELDPEGTKYQASGIGRSDIRRDLLHALGRG